jgi:hypothetical protein
VRAWASPPRRNRMRSAGVARLCTGVLLARCAVYVLNA